MKSFKQFLQEVNISGPGGVFGAGQNLAVGGLVGNFDTYAPEDNRIPKIIGTFKRAGMDKRKSKAKLKRAIKRKSKRQ